MPMSTSRRDLARRLLGAARSRSAAFPAAAPPTSPPPLATLAQRVAARATFGANAAVVAAIEAEGVARWLARQLEPLSIDDSAAEQLVEAAIEPWRSVAPDVRLLARALFSQRQLAWRMVHFLNNHFATYTGSTVPISESREDDALFKTCLGDFATVLRTSATSPAMIDFLDAQSNIVGNPNENYARELLELHTLGVGSGYTEPDVAEVARVFTGWTRVRVPNPAGGSPIDSYFRFRPARHDTGPKALSLGWSTPGIAGPSGYLEGFALLDFLAAHPATATFFTAKLCRYFVADAPPAALVNRVRQTFVATGGDLRATVRAIFLDPDFATASLVPNKAQDGFEWIVQILRRAELPSVNLLAVNNRIGALASQPHQFPVPTGYPEVGAAWQGAGRVLPRWVFADDWAHDRIGQTPVPWSTWYTALPAGGAAWVTSLLDRFADGEVPATTVLALTVFMDNRLAALPPNPTFNQVRPHARDLLALVLQLPEVQLH